MERKFGKYLELEQVAHTEIPPVVIRRGKHGQDKDA